MKKSILFLVLGCLLCFIGWGFYQKQKPSAKLFTILKENYTKPTTQKEWNDDHKDDPEELKDFPYPNHCFYDPKGNYCIGGILGYSIGGQNNIKYSGVFEYKVSEQKQALKSLRHYLKNNAFSHLLKRSYDKRDLYDEVYDHLISKLIKPEIFKTMDKLNKKPVLKPQNVDKSLLIYKSFGMIFHQDFIKEFKPIPLCPHKVVYPAIVWGKNILISNEDWDNDLLKDNSKRKKDFIRLSDNDYGSDDLWAIEKLKSPSQKIRLKITFFNPLNLGKADRHLNDYRSSFLNEEKNCLEADYFYRINK